MPKKIKKPSNKLPFVLFIAAFAVVGGALYLYRSHAATPTEITYATMFSQVGENAPIKSSSCSTDAFSTPSGDLRLCVFVTSPQGSITSTPDFNAVHGQEKKNAPTNPGPQRQDRAAIGLAKADDLTPLKFFDGTGDADNPRLAVYDGVIQSFSCNGEQFVGKATVATPFGAAVYGLLFRTNQQGVKQAKPAVYNHHTKNCHDISGNQWGNIKIVNPAFQSPNQE